MAKCRNLWIVEIVQPCCIDRQITVVLMFWDRRLGFGINYDGFELSDCFGRGTASE